MAREQSCIRLAEQGAFGGAFFGAAIGYWGANSAGVASDSLEMLKVVSLVAIVGALAWACIWPVLYFTLAQDFRNASQAVGAPGSERAPEFG